MFRNDHTLLHTPQLMALIMHQAEDGTATVETCLARLKALLDQAGAPLPFSPEEIRQTLTGHLQALRLAQLIEPGEAGFRLTGRGRDAMARHPLGFDRSDLMVYPEYAAAVAERAHHSAGMDARQRSYDQGYAARRSGRPFTDNPHTENTVDHWSWENGWMEAFDAPEDGVP